MINVKKPKVVLDFCKACNSRDTNDPQTISYAINENNQNLFSLCKDCRLELLIKLAQSLK